MVINVHSYNVTVVLRHATETNRNKERMNPNCWLFTSMTGQLNRGSTEKQLQPSGGFEIMTLFRTQIPYKAYALCGQHPLLKTQFRIRDKLRSLLQEFNYDFYTCQGATISRKILAERKQELEKVT